VPFARSARCRRRRSRAACRSPRLKAGGASGSDFAGSRRAGAMRFASESEVLAPPFEHGRAVVELLTDAGSRLPELAIALPSVRATSGSPLRAEHDEGNDENDHQLWQPMLTSIPNALESAERVKVVILGMAAIRATFTIEGCAALRRLICLPAEARIYGGLVKPETLPFLPRDQRVHGARRSIGARAETALRRIRQALRFDGLWWRKFARSDASMSRMVEAGITAGRRARHLPPRRPKPTAARSRTNGASSVIPAVASARGRLPGLRAYSARMTETMSSTVRVRPSSVSRAGKKSVGPSVELGRVSSWRRPRRQLDISARASRNRAGRLPVMGREPTKRSGIRRRKPRAGGRVIFSAARYFRVQHDSRASTETRFLAIQIDPARRAELRREAAALLRAEASSRRTFHLVGVRHPGRSGRHFAPRLRHYEIVLGDRVGWRATSRRRGGGRARRSSSSSKGFANIPGSGFSSLRSGRRSGDEGPLDLADDYNADGSLHRTTRY